MGAVLSDYLPQTLNKRLQSTTSAGGDSMPTSPRDRRMGGGDNLVPCEEKLSIDTMPPIQPLLDDVLTSPHLVKCDQPALSPICIGGKSWATVASAAAAKATITASPRSSVTLTAQQPTPPIGEVPVAADLAVVTTTSPCSAEVLPVPIMSAAVEDEHIGQRAPTPISNVTTSVTIASPPSVPQQSPPVLFSPRLSQRDMATDAARVIINDDQLLGSSVQAVDVSFTWDADAVTPATSMTPKDPSPNSPSFQHDEQPVQRTIAELLADGCAKTCEQLETVMATDKKKVQQQANTDPHHVKKVVVLYDGFNKFMEDERE